MQIVSLANIFQFHKYQTFVLIIMRNTTKNQPKRFKFILHTRLIFIMDPLSSYKVKLYHNFFYDMENRDSKLFFLKFYREICFFLFIISKLYKYNGFWVIVNWEQRNWSFTKCEPLNMLFHQFRYFHFSHFNMTFDINILWKSFLFLRRIVEVLVSFYYLTKLRKIGQPLTVKWWPFQFFSKFWTRTRYCCLLFQNCRFMANLIFLISMIYKDGFWTIAN